MSKKDCTVTYDIIPLICTKDLHVDESSVKLGEKCKEELLKELADHIEIYYCGAPRGSKFGIKGGAMALIYIAKRVREDDV